MKLLDVFNLNKDIWNKHYKSAVKDFDFFAGTIYELLLKKALENPSNKALSYFDQEYTYSDFLNEIDAAAAALIELGIEEGDVVTIIMPNTPEALFMVYGANKIGAISSMLHPLSGEEEIKLSVNNTKSRIVLAIDLCYNKIINIINETSIEKVIVVSASKSMKWYYKAGYFVTSGYKISKPLYNNTFIEYSDFIGLGKKENRNIVAKGVFDNPAIILHSGGTTGTPKGILLSNLNVNSMAEQMKIIFYLRGVDKWEKPGTSLALLPIFHGFGLAAAIHTAITLGFDIHLMPQFDPKTFDKTFYKVKPSLVLGVPSLFDYLRKSRFLANKDLSFLKFPVIGGDKLSRKAENTLNEFLNSHGAESAFVGYGLTEGTAAVITSMVGDRKPETIGIPLYSNDIKIVTPGTQSEVEANETGEICISGPTVMMGYLNNEQETNLALQKHSNGKIYLHTGDLGKMDEEGYITYVQRLKRMIITSGYNVYPAYVEDVLSQHEAVLSAVVVGKKHKYKGEVAHAYIVLKDGYRESIKLRKELRALCEKTLAKYSLPYRYHFRDSLPETKLGKVNYRMLEEEDEE